jgi:hypothetical protein
MATSTPNGLWSPDPSDLVDRIDLNLGQMQQSTDDAITETQQALSDLGGTKTGIIDDTIVTGPGQHTVWLSTVAGFSTYRVIIMARSSVTSSSRHTLRMRFNGDADPVYDSLRTINEDGAVTTAKTITDSWMYVGRIPAAGSTISTNNMGAVVITLPWARTLTNFKACTFQWGGRQDVGTVETGTGWAQRRSVEVVTSVRFDLPGDAAFVPGSRFILEGVPTS